MVEGKRVAVVVPAYEEEQLVADTIRGVPDFVDLVVVVDDCSSDGTAERARGTGDQRLVVIRHEENRGVGAAIATGYARCRELGVDVTCVMAADNQMDPVELASLVGPVAETIVDHARKSDCDMIFMGTRGMTALSNMVMGSVATKVLHLAHIPVVLIH